MSIDCCCSSQFAEELNSFYCQLESPYDKWLATTSRAVCMTYVHALFPQKHSFFHLVHREKLTNFSMSLSCVSNVVKAWIPNQMSAVCTCTPSLVPPSVPTSVPPSLPWLDTPLPCPGGLCSSAVYAEPCLTAEGQPFKSWRFSFMCLSILQNQSWGFNDTELLQNKNSICDILGGHSGQLAPLLTLSLFKKRRRRKI